MFNKGYGKKLLSIGLVSSIILLSPVNTFAENVNNNKSTEIRALTNQNKQISKVEATKALENYVTQQGYKHGAVSLEKELYDVDDSLIAYFFTIADKSGYYIVTAVDTLNPIMEYSIDAPFSVNLKNNEQRKAYYVGLSNIIFASNAEEVNQRFQNERIESLKEIQIEKDKLNQYKNDQIIAKNNLEMNIKKEKNASSKTNYSSLNCDITKKQDEIDSNLKVIEEKEQEYNRIQKALETETLVPFAKKMERSHLWDELLYDKNPNKLESLAAPPITKRGGTQCT